jgi:hypothetical protein
MMKIANMVKTVVTGRLNNASARRSSLAAACLGIALAPALFSCAPTTMSNEKTMAEKLAAAQQAAERTSQAPLQTVDQQNAPGKVQELSVREESGQTILTIKLAKAIAQYRHFSIPQPVRIVLDVFNDAKPSETETYRIASNSLGHMKVSSGDGYTRMTLEIMAGAVPQYVVTPDDGGVRIVIGGMDPKITAKRSFDLVKSGKRVEQRMTEAGITAMAAESGGAARTEG